MTRTHASALAGLATIALWYGACASAPTPRLSPETREAAVRFALSEARERCRDFLAPDPPASEVRDACLVLLAVDNAVVVITPDPDAGAPVDPTRGVPTRSLPDDGPVSGDGGP